MTKDIKYEIAVLAGGGGHSALAQIICETLKQSELRDKKLKIYIPSKDKVSFIKLKKYGSIEKIVKPEMPLDSFSVNIILRHMQALIESLHKIKNHKLVISTGSNFCIFPAIISKLKGAKIINLEVPDRIYKPSITPRILQYFSTTILNWKKQKQFYRRGNVVGPLLYPPKKAKKGKYILVFFGTLKDNTTIDKLIGISEKVDEKIKIIYKGKLKQKPTKNITIIKNVLTEKEVDNLIEKSKLVITHTGFTLFKALSYKKPCLITTPKNYKKGAGKDDVKFLAKTFNVSYGDITEKNISLALLKKSTYPPTKKTQQAFITRLIDTLET